MAAIWGFPGFASVASQKSFCESRLKVTRVLFEFSKYAFLPSFGSFTTYRVCTHAHYIVPSVTIEINFMPSLNDLNASGL